MWAVVLAVAGSACDSVSDPVSGNGVFVRADDKGLIVRNLTGEPIYTFAVDRDMAALISWVRCSDPVSCEGIRPRRTVRVPRERIGDWNKDGDILLYWWQLRPAPGGGFTPGPEGFVVVRR